MAFYNLKTINDICILITDRTPSVKQSGVVYSIPCICRECYIGKTKEDLKDRVKKYQYNCRDHRYKKKHHSLLIILILSIIFYFTRRKLWIMRAIHPNDILVKWFITI